MDTFALLHSIWDGLVLEPSPAQFAEFYACTWEPLMGYCCNILHNPELCEEVTQATYVALWEHLQTGEPGMGTDALAMLIQVANLEIDRQRKLFCRELRRHVDLAHARELRSGGLPQREVVCWRESVRAFDELLDKMPPELARPFRMHYFEERSHKEIAAELRVDRSVVTKRIAKALLLLRERVLG